MNTSNFYAPERHANESFDDYKKRRRVSQRKAAMLKEGVNNTSVERWQRESGKPPGRVDRRRAAVKASKPVPPRPKFAKERKRIPALGHRPTWPKTEDQAAQSRPLIVINPVWQLKKMKAYNNVAAFYGPYFHEMPKHELDNLVLSYAKV